MKTSIFKGKSIRTKLFALITAVSVIVLLALNFILKYAVDANGFYGDMTMEDFYTVTDLMKEELDFVEDLKDENGDPMPVKITFCTDPDYLMSSMVTRMTYVMALKLAREFSNVEVETVNAALNPTAVAAYKSNSLSKISASDIIVSYGSRYRVSNANGYWKKGNTYSDEYFYNGEYYLASLIKSVTAVDQPSAYFVIDHGEKYYDEKNPESEMSLELSSFYDLLVQRGLKVKTLRLSEEEIPDDCVLLIINNPTEDFEADPSKFGEISYVSQTEKLDKYLIMNQGAIIVAKDYERKLTLLDDFLFEWGFSLSSEKLLCDSDSQNSLSADGSEIIAEYNTSEASFGYAIYGEYSDLSSAPVTVFKNTGYIECSYGDSTKVNEPGSPNVSRSFAQFIATPNSAKPYAKNPITGEYVDVAGEEGAYNLAAVGVREEFDDEKNVSKYSYVFCVNSPDFLSSSLLSNTSYANYDILSATIETISDIDVYASDDLGGNSFNYSYGKRFVTLTMSENDFTVRSNKLQDPDNIGAGGQFVKFNYGLSSSAKIAYSIVIGIIPAAIAVFGIIVCAKRKYK